MPLFKKRWSSLPSLPFKPSSRPGSPAPSPALADLENHFTPNTLYSNIPSAQSPSSSLQSSPQIPASPRVFKIKRKPVPSIYDLPVQVSTEVKDIAKSFGPLERHFAVLNCSDDVRGANVEGVPCYEVRLTEDNYSSPPRTYTSDDDCSITSRFGAVRRNAIRRNSGPSPPRTNTRRTPSSISSASSFFSSSSSSSLINDYIPNNRHSDTPEPLDPQEFSSDESRASTPGPFTPTLDSPASFVEEKSSYFSTLDSNSLCPGSPTELEPLRPRCASPLIMTPTRVHAFGGTYFLSPWGDHSVNEKLGGGSDDDEILEIR